MLKRLKKYNVNYDLLVILSFIALSIVSVLFIWNKGVLNGNDLYFHLDRILELSRSNTIFPRFATNSFAGNGSAVMTMYPYLLLYPFGILLHITKNIPFVVYSTFIVSLFLSFMVSYFSAIHLNKSVSLSYLFSLLYTLSYEFLSLSFWSCDLGMTLAAIFLPMVLFGYINWLKTDKWLMISIGMSLIIYSNVPIAIFTPACLIIWTLINYDLLNRVHVVNLAKAVILTLCTTAVFLLPAIKLFISNKIYGSKDDTLGEGIGSVSLHDSFIHTLKPTESFIFNGWFPWELTIYSFIGLIIGLFIFKKLNIFIKQGYILSIMILLLSSNLFPWHHHIFNYLGGMLQTTVRMYLIPQVLLTYIFAYVIYLLLAKIKNVQVETLIKTIIILIICTIQIGYILIFHNQQHLSVMHGNGIFHSKIVRLSNVPHIDYYPGSKRSMNIISKDNGIITNTENNHKLKYIKPLGKGDFKFYNKYTYKKLSIPFLYYHGITYKCYLNNHLVKSYPNNNQFLTINHVAPGHHFVSIKISLDAITIISRMMTFGTIPAYFVLFVRRKRI